jgi:hypothetical protein
VAVNSLTLLDHPLASIAVETDSVLVRTQLRERLEPYVRVTGAADREARGAHPPDLMVTAVVRPAPLPAGPSAEVMIRDHSQFERYRRPADLWRDASEYVMRERKNSTVFRWGTTEPARVVVSNADAGSLAKSVRRLVQDFLRLRVWHNGGVIVEASAFAIDGTSLLAVGGSGAGKTTLLARFLESGAAMVSNDEVALLHADGEVTAYGLPMLVNVRPPLADRFPCLRDLTHAHFLAGPDSKAPVRYDAFAEALGGRVQASTEGLIGVRLTPDAAPASDVDPAAFSLALVQNMLSGPGVVGPGWASPWRLLPPGFPEASQSELRQRAARIAEHVPAIAVGRLNSLTCIAEAVRARRAATSAVS